MWIIIIVLVFVFTIGLTIGGLLAAPKESIKPLHLLLFSLFFLFLCYMGMITGMFITGWMSIRVFEIVLAILAILFIVACFSRYHPTLGFFHPEDRVLISLLAFLFFIMGVEWGLLGFRTFFTITTGFIFSASLTLGLFVQLQIRQALWRHSATAFIPLIWLLFVSVLKLL